MEIFTTKAELSCRLEMLKSQGSSIGFVATMGALHQGHIELVTAALETCSVCVCSIFVNPTQFNNAEDLEHYPRTLDADFAKLRGAGCQFVFVPEVSEMYSEDEHWHIELGSLDSILEGAFRPGHYQGVTQIVKKLFDCIKPDYAFFGQKDYQQFLVIAKMSAEFNLDVKLIMYPIVREHDGLAMSSRNARLSADERQSALVLYSALQIIANGFNRTPVAQLQSKSADYISSHEGVKLEYLEIRERETLKPAENAVSGRLIALVAAWVGNTRLIDNVLLS